MANEQSSWLQHLRQISQWSRLVYSSFYYDSLQRMAKCSCSGYHVHVRSCYYQLRRLIRRLVSTNVFSTIVHGFVCSCINYCNPLLLRLPKGSAFPCVVCLKCFSRTLKAQLEMSYNNRCVNNGLENLVWHRLSNGSMASQLIHELITISYTASGATNS